VRPAAATTPPRTGFDVDLHEPKASDSYESISQEWYNDRRYGTALKAYNQNKPLQGGHSVEVPPVHVLRKRYPSMVGTATPVGGSSGAAPSTTPDWTPAAVPGAEPLPSRATGLTRGTYVVPQGAGMTLKSVARTTLGNEQRWRDLYDLNKHIDPAEVLQPGTELKMPPDAR
jgi:hypothetical protein